MFCVLNVEKRKPTFFEKIFKFIQNDEYEIKTVPVFRGAPFYVLDIKVAGEINWDVVIEHTGKCANRLLVSDKIQIPQRSDMGHFKGDILYNKSFKNTLLQILKFNNLAKNPQHIAVLDKKGSNGDFVAKLSKYASHLTVVTEQKEKYMDVCENILNDTGLCISLRSDFDDAKIKIDTDRNIMSVMWNKEIYNISKGEDLIVEEIYKKLLPKDVCDYNFYSALYELCGVFSLGNCIFENITVNNEKKQVQSIQFT